jgi:hypothetical protein
MRRRSQRGQSVILVAASLGTMLLVVALAVDAGLAYLRAQQSQAIADAAARSAQPALPDCARADLVARHTVDLYRDRQGADLSGSTTCTTNPDGMDVTVKDSFPVFMAGLMGGADRGHISRTSHVSAPAQAHEHLQLLNVQAHAQECWGGVCLNVAPLRTYPSSQPPYAFSPCVPANPALKLTLDSFQYAFSQAVGDQQGPLQVWIESYGRYEDGSMADLEGRSVSVSGPGGTFTDGTVVTLPDIAGHRTNGPSAGMINFRFSWYDEDANPHFLVSPTFYYRTLPC